MDPSVNNRDMVDSLQGYRSRKRMRKGTRSCTECRRRKTRCTFDSNRPGTCRECGLRGTTCLEQEQDSRREDQQPYSLRERVVELETVVQTLLRRLDAIDGGSYVASTVLYQPAANVKEPLSTCLPGFDWPDKLVESRPTNGVNLIAQPTVTDGVELNPVNEQMVTAPVLRLFDNDVVSRRGCQSSDSLASSPHTASASRAKAARTALLSLLPPHNDITRLVESSLMWWSAWQAEFPEICRRCRVDVTLGQSLCDNPMSPADAAKALLCLVLSVEQLPGDYDYACLSVPFTPQEWINRSIDAVVRFVIYDDEFASTLTGIESHILLSKYYINQGRLRKAWLTARRGIEFAQLTGVHWCTTKPPLLPTPLFDRRLQIWCAAATVDRFLSLILGLPYAVPDAFLLPQVTACLQRESSPPAYTYMARLALVLGKIVDRDQSSSEQSISRTLLLDEELADMIKCIPEHWWRTSGQDNRKMAGKCYETAILRFLHQVIRAFAHLPYLLKHTADPKSQCCRLTALESARESLLAYREFRATNRPYLYRLMDFLAFTMAMLLVIHSVGYSGMPSLQPREQDSQDIDLVREAAEILAKVGTNNGGTAALESSKIIQGILGHWAAGSGSHPRRCETLKICLPYFGAITICPGKVLAEQLQRKPRVPEPFYRCQKQQPPLCPLLAAADGPNGDKQRNLVGQTSTDPQSEYLNSPQFRLEGAPSFSDAGWELSGFFDDFGYGLWSGLDINHGLDQG